MKLILRYLLFTTLVTSSALAQNMAVVRGHFDADSVSIGEKIPYSLTVRYSRFQQVLFPDSTFSFAPFEIVSKKFYPTRSNESQSYDSAVYWLTTFEIDSTQRLGLPVFILQGKDCVVVAARPDSIALQFRVAHIPDTVSAEKLPLKTNTLYQKVKWILNYPLYAIILGGVLVLLIVAWIIFGKRVRKYFALRKLHKEYVEFINHFNSVIHKMSSGYNRPTAEEALVVWKDYMENLTKFPFTKFTSREIQRLSGDPNLDQALRSIDRGIYGGFASTAEPFQFLQSYSEERFKKREEEVKNG